MCFYGLKMIDVSIGKKIRRVTFLPGVASQNVNANKIHLRAFYTTIYNNKFANWLHEI
jgi:hypothetical protein